MSHVFRFPGFICLADLLSIFSLQRWVIHIHGTVFKRKCIFIKIMHFCWKYKENYKEGSKGHLYHSPSRGDYGGILCIFTCVWVPLPNQNYITYSLLNPAFSLNIVVNIHHAAASAGAGQVLAKLSVKCHHRCQLLQRWQQGSGQLWWWRHLGKSSRRTVNSQAVVGMGVEVAVGKGTPGSKKQQCKDLRQNLRQRGGHSQLCQPSPGIWALG